MQRETSIITEQAIERMLDNAATCSQSRDLLEEGTRECLKLNLVKPLIKAIVEEARVRVQKILDNLPPPDDRTERAAGGAYRLGEVLDALSDMVKTDA